MSTVDLVITPRDRGEHVASDAWSSTDQPTLHIDPIDDVAFGNLLAIATGQDAVSILAQFNSLTPEQPDVEPWGVDELLACVLEIPTTYTSVRA